MKDREITCKTEEVRISIFIACNENQGENYVYILEDGEVKITSHKWKDYLER